MEIILKWDAERMLNALNDLVDGKENALIDYFGEDNWNELLIASGGTKMTPWIG